MTTPSSAHPAGEAPATEHYDVVIVGYGPVGRLLALKLGLRGHRVLIVERQRATYPLPRAVHMDDETARILQSVASDPAKMSHAVEPYDDFYEWRSADRRTLTRLDWRGRGPSGWNVSNFFHQPDVEHSLHQQVMAQPTVEVRYGWRAVAHHDDGERVTLQLQSREDERMAVSGRYVVGADGANSIVREWIGGTVTDLGYFHDWLVVDLVPHEPVTVEPPAWQLCDPARPTTLVPGGPGRRRFEFMRLPHETIEELNAEATAWKLLEPWGVTPGKAKLERHAVYTFQARWCEQWRHGRLLLAGDSAHLMPPFAGQGMCSGLRDAANLEWKLHLVLTGRADEAILDGYGPERAEHVRHFIDASMALGEIICVTDPAAVKERDDAMTADLAAGVRPAPRPLPRLGPGLHRESGGTLSIQAPVRSEHGEGLFDDVTDGGGTLLLDGPDLAAGLSHGQRERLSELGFQIVALSGDVGSGQVVDVAGDYRRWMTELAARAVLIRPDFYLYGTAADTVQLHALLGAFFTDLGPGS